MTGLRVRLAMLGSLLVGPAAAEAVPAVFIEDQAVWKTPEAFERATSMTADERKAAIACEAKAGTRLESIGAARGSWLWLVEVKSGPNAGCRGVVKPLSFRAAATAPAASAPQAAPAPPPAAPAAPSAEVAAPPPVQRPALEHVDVAAEVELLRRQLGAVSDTEGQCLAAAASGGVSSSTQSGGSYQGRSASTYDSSLSATSRRSGYRGRTYSESYSASSSNVESGSSSYGSSSSYTTPEMRADACRAQAESSRQGILGSIELAGRDPEAFASIIRQNRARERHAQAQRAAWFDQVITGVTADLEALAAPTVPTIEDWSVRLESLEGGLAHLWKAAPQDGKATAAIQSVQRAIDACRPVRARLTASAQQADEVALAERTLLDARARLGGASSSPVARVQLESHEHNVKIAKERAARSEKQTETEWRRALPATQAALRAVTDLRASMAAAPAR